ncbi:prolipoprotein diacylglyceryl transferase [Tessaracoccus sp. ZS01]|uniref:prolipoprotein diacylglyceryl transferase n=1 Tax=Tessaracoccus sp. ZS01 TaxID=1906324 RepID=UPI001E554139|nr:prolipoprotein diacylglyceryl transferase [Tessaracoccus sp. ZS01]
MNPLVLTFPDFDPVALNVFGLKIHWYAIMYLLAFGMAYGLMRRRLAHEPYRSITKPQPWSSADIEDILLASIIGVIVGGRLGYSLFYTNGYHLQNPLEIIRVWDGGMSFHGGAIGVVLGLAWYAWRKKRPFLQVGDFLAPSVPIGLAAGRFGNFINGELWGRPAPESLPWAMIFPTGGDVPRHPSMLYQMLLEGVLLFILLWFYARRPRFRGQVTAAFLAGYGLFRFIAEFWREPDAQLGLLGLGLSMGQWLSLPMILIGVGLWLWAHNRAIDDREEPVDNPGDNSAGEEAPDEASEGARKADDTLSDVREDPEGSPRDN